MDRGFLLSCKLTESLLWNFTDANRDRTEKQKMLKLFSLGKDTNNKNANMRVSIKKK